MQEEEKLSLLARRPKSAQALALRARIVLSCAEGLRNSAVAKKVHVIGATVCKWRERFRVGRVEGLLDEPRPGALSSIGDAQIEEVITNTLESMPDNSTHWSTRLMAQKTGLSQTAIVRIWRARSDCSRIEWKISSFPKIRSLWKGAGYCRVVFESARSSHRALWR